MRKKKQTGHRKRDYNPSEWDDSKSVEVTPERRIKRPTEYSTSIRLPGGMIRRLRRIAARKGDIGYQTLLKIWIAERLEVELKPRKRA